MPIASMPKDAPHNPKAGRLHPAIRAGETLVIILCPCHNKGYCVKFLGSLRTLNHLILLPAVEFLGTIEDVESPNFFASWERFSDTARASVCGGK